MKSRIKPIDGLRACAVLGVLWAHIWMFFDNIPFYLGGKDINRFLSFGGIGVDLFFVISGFCMYLMYAKKSETFSLQSYLSFFKKRWLRIAPAFYLAVIVESLIYLVKSGLFPYQTMVSHLLFLNIFFDSQILSPSFWSLATEWHFYLILPFLFIGLKGRYSLVSRVLLLCAICVGFRLYNYRGNLFLTGQTISSDMIWYRFIEFGWGIIAAWYYLNVEGLPKWLKGNPGFLIAAIIALLGRGLMANELLAKFGNLAFVGRAMGEPVLTLGFALMILNLVQSESAFQKVLSTSFFQFIGKISYSFYLWHWILASNLSFYIKHRYGTSNLVFEISFLLSFVILVILSWISYKWLEEPYFKKRSEPASGENKTQLATSVN